jgi:cysteine rich repeat protein
MRVKTNPIRSMLFAAVALACAPAFAAQDLAETTMAGCKTEIDTYCKDVTAGEGRMIACLLAHEDHLSGRCEYHLYDAAVQLERVAAAMQHVATECHAELMAHCTNVPVGEGQIAKCLKTNEATATDKCKQAMHDTQMQVH